MELFYFLFRGFVIALVEVLFYLLVLFLRKRFKACII